jgi:hypothetical protein
VAIRVGTSQVDPAEELLRRKQRSERFGTPLPPLIAEMEVIHRQKEM